MDVLLVSARTTAAECQAEAGTVSTLAAGLVTAGVERVRWLCPWPPDGEPPPTPPPGVEFESVLTAVPPFRKVTTRLMDLRTEARLVKALRHEPPDVVHVRGFGRTSSYLLAWTADRLGVPSVVETGPRETVVCHRGTLRDWTGTPCADWLDARRCRRCTTAHDADALGAMAAFWAAVLRPLRGLSPLPSKADFENRADMLAHGLTPASRVLVPTRDDLDALAALGVSTRSFRVGLPNADEVAEWLSVYREIVRETPSP